MDRRLRGPRRSSLGRNGAWNARPRGGAPADRTAEGSPPGVAPPASEGSRGRTGRPAALFSLLLVLFLLVSAGAVSSAPSAPAATSVWFVEGQHLRQVDANTGKAKKGVKLAGKLRGIAADPADGSVSVLQGGRLHTYDAYGRETLDKATGLPQARADAPALLAESPADGSLWAASGGALLRLDAKGNAAGKAELDGDAARALVPSQDGGAWVLGQKGKLYRLSKQGEVLQERDATDVIEAPRWLTADEVGGGLYVAGERGVARLDLEDEKKPAREISTGDATIEGGIAVDPYGRTLYVATRDAVLIYGEDGRYSGKADFEAQEAGQISGLSFDASGGRLWIGGQERLIGLAKGGTKVTTGIEADGLSALSAAPPRLSPRLSAVEPEGDAEVEDPEQPVRLKIQALCSGAKCPARLDGYAEGLRVEATLNGKQVGEHFEVEGGEALYAPEGGLPEGENELVAQVVDRFGNRSEKLTMGFSVPDRAAPEFGGVEPEDGATVQDEKATITGRVDDPEARVSLEGLEELGGKAVSEDPEGFSFEVPLEEGENSFELVARDASGNEGEQQLRIVREAKPEETEPEETAPEGSGDAGPKEREASKPQGMIRPLGVPGFSGAESLATATVQDQSTVWGANFKTLPPNGSPYTVSTALSSFPTDGENFAVLTTGDASLARTDNTSGSSGANLGGGSLPERGSTAYDITVLEMDLTAPEGANCLRFDFAFYSEEYPEYVDSDFNDAFVAELDSTTWASNGRQVNAPDNFAFDAEGDVSSVVSVNNSGSNTSMNDTNARGTTYDGATAPLSASTPVSPGNHKLYLSVFDLGDHSYDSAVFVDNIRFEESPNPETSCARGSKPDEEDPPFEEPDPDDADDHGDGDDPSSRGGDPINFTTGNMYEYREDLNIPGKGFPLQFIRYYNSQDTYNGPLGFGWTHNYNTQLKEEADGTITELDPQGKRLRFTRNADGSYAAPKDIEDELTKATDGTFELRKKNGYEWYFGSDGKLQEIADPKGNAVTLSYDSGGRLTKLTDTAGRETLLGYNASGRMTTLTDPAGNATRYTYFGGRLVSVTDPEGNSTNYEYDAKLNMTRITNKDGNEVSFTYDADDRVASTSGEGGAQEMTLAYDETNSKTTVTDSKGEETVFHYNDMSRVTRVLRPDLTEVNSVWDANGNKTSRTDARSYTGTAAYDAKGNRTQVVGPDGATINRAYGSLSKVTSSTDPEGHERRYTYDANGNLLESVDPLGNKTTFTYDASGQLLKETRPDGTTKPDGTPGTASTSYAYDAQGNMVEETDALGYKTAYAYDSLGRVTSKTDALGRATKYAYDRLGHVTKVTNPDGTSRNYSYDANGNLQDDCDENGNCTHTRYDAQNRPVERRDALENSTYYEYDTEGNLVAETDALGRKKTYEYDTLQRLVKANAPDGTRNPGGTPGVASTSYEYDAAGNRTKVTDAAGHATRMSYDAAGRLLSVTDPLNNTTTYVYDKLGRKTKATDPEGNATTYEYDALGRQTKVTRPDGTTNPNGSPGTVSTSYAYDAAGNRTKVTDPLGRATSMSYDALGRLTKVTDPMNGVASFEYDALGRQTKVTNPNAHATSHGYDVRGRLAEEKDPLGNVTAYAYDPAGNLKSRTDAERRTTTYAYDRVNRPLSATYPDASKVETAYDAAGNALSVAGKGGKISFAYDDRNLPTSETLPDGRQIKREYDRLGNRTALTGPDGKRTLYSYDANHRMSGVTDPDGNRTSFEHDALGRTSKITRPGGAVETRAHDPLGRSTSITYASPATAGSQKRAYEYDKANNPTSTTDETGRQSTYSYDGLDRLLKETHPEAVLSYAYDRAGNRTSQTRESRTVSGSLPQTTAYAYDAAERMTRADSATFGYDRIGNMTSKTVGKGTTRYAYDYEGRLTSAGTVGYKRDALGRVSATERLITSGTTATPAAPFEPKAFVHDGSEVVQEKDQAGNVTSYTRGAGGRLVSAKKGTASPSYYHHDPTGSVVRLTDGAGATTDAYSYEAFGTVLKKTGTSGQPYGYVGNRSEPASGLSDFHARAYDPGVGRFTSKDPVKILAQMPQTLNSYAYGVNEPLAYPDPSGRSILEPGDGSNLTGPEIPPPPCPETTCDFDEAPVPRPIPRRNRARTRSSTRISRAMSGYGPDLPF